MFPGRILRDRPSGKKFALHLSPLLLGETRYALLLKRLQDSYGRGDKAVLAWCADLEGIASLSAGPRLISTPSARIPTRIASLPLLSL